MPAREYCCCAIPIVNAGIYAALLEQLAFGVVAGTLSVATTSSMFRQAEADPLLRSFTEAYHFCSRRRRHTRCSQMDLHHSLLYRSSDSSIGFRRRCKGEQTVHPQAFRSTGQCVERPSYFLRKNPFCSNDIYRLVGSSPSPGSRYPSLGSSSPPLDIPRPKLIAKGTTIPPAPRVISPLRSQTRRTPSATSSRGLMSGSWEDYGSSS